MKLKAPIIKISDEDPFHNDLLDREKSAGVLTELLRSTDESIVVCIDAPWGEGKTTFLRMWRALLKKQKFPILYFNAWENDFSQDALVSLIGELSLELENLNIKNDKGSKAKEHLDKAKKLGATLIKRAIPTGVRIATAGLLDLNEVTEDALSSLGEKIAQEQIEKYGALKKTVDGFRKELALFNEQLISRPEGYEKTKLVVLVDELDRCRPTYAIEVLERVKHFFSVPNAAFVIAVDKQQLGHSIRSIYGLGMDVNGYLRRFIDFDYSLPQPEKGAFCKAQFERFGLREFFDKRITSRTRNDYSQFEKLFTELFLILGCTLREQEHCFALLSVAIRTTPEDHLLYPILLGTLIVLKIKNPELYRGFVVGKVKPSEVLDYLRSQPEGSELLDANYGIALEAYLRTCRMNGSEFNKLLLEYQSLADGAKDPEKERVLKVLKLLNDFEGNDTYGILNGLVQKIDMVSKFEH